MTKTKGILLIVCSAFCFAFMNLFVRLSGDIPSVQKSFFRNVVALIFALIILKKDKKPIKADNAKLGKTEWFAMIVRAVAGTLGILCNFYAVDHLILSDASILNKMSPFFAIVFSMIILKEKLSAFQIGAVITAFLGAMLVVKPSFSNANLLASCLGMLGGIGAGLAYTAVRYLGTHGVNGSLIVAFFSGFSCAVTLPFLLFNYHSMSVLQFTYLLLAGLAAAGGQFSITAAYSYAPAKEISVYDYSQIIFAAVLGFIFFGDQPDILSLVGYLIIITVAIANFKYSRSKK